MLVKQANATAAANASTEFYDKIETELRWVAEKSIEVVLKNCLLNDGYDLDSAYEILLPDKISSKYATWPLALLFILCCDNN